MRGVKKSSDASMRRSLRKRLSAKSSSESVSKRWFACKRRRSESKMSSRSEKKRRPSRSKP